MTGQELYAMFREETNKEGSIDLVEWGSLPDEYRKSYNNVAKRINKSEVNSVGEGIFKQTGHSFQDYAGCWYVVDEDGRVIGSFYEASR